MAEPVVPKIRYTDAAAQMAELEVALLTIDDDADLILADKNAAVASNAAAQATAKKLSFSFMLGGA